MARINGPHRRWTEQEDEIVRAKYVELGTYGLADILGRSHSSIANRAHRLGLNTSWTPQEIEILEKHYPYTDAAKKLCNLLPGRSVDAIRIKARLLGLVGCELWEEWEEDILKENYGDMPPWRLVELLPGRTSIAIGHKARKMGLHRAPRWSAEEEDILRNHFGKMSSEKLVEMLPGRSYKAICAKGTELGIRRPPSQQWSKAEDEVIKTHYKTKSADEVAAMLPERTTRSVYKRAQILGLAQRYKYSANRNFFAIPNRLNSYWAGFIAADGCITGKQTVAITLHKRDADHLRRFASDANFTGRVDLYDRIENKFGKEQVFSKADIKIHCAPEWLHQLEENFGIGRHKSLTMKPPKGLSRENALAFIAGYFDGDGWFTTPNPTCLVMGFCGTFDTMVWIQEHCDSIAPPSSLREGSVPSIVGKLGYYTVSGRRAAIVTKEMLRLRIPRLDRKWDKIARRVLELQEDGHYQANLF